jgi:hypothetical protein
MCNECKENINSLSRAHETAGEALVEALYGILATPKPNVSQKTVAACAQRLLDFYLTETAPELEAFGNCGRWNYFDTFRKLAHGLTVALAVERKRAGGKSTYLDSTYQKDITNDLILAIDVIVDAYSDFLLNSGEMCEDCNEECHCDECCCDECDCCDCCEDCDGECGCDCDCHEDKSDETAKESSDEKSNDEIACQWLLNTLRAIEEKQRKAIKEAEEKKVNEAVKARERAKHTLRSPFIDAPNELRAQYLMYLLGW